MKCVYFGSFNLLLLTLAACSQASKQPPYPNNAAISDIQGTPRDTTTFYFPAADSLHATYIPPAKRPKNCVLDERVTNCAADLISASYCLTYFEAPVLANYYLQKPIYRFLWLRSFHRPVLLTLCQQATGATLRTQVLDKFPGFRTLSVFHPDSLPATASPKARAYAKRFYEETIADPAFQAEIAANKRRAVQVKNEETTILLTQPQYQTFERLLQQAHFWQLPSCQPVPGLLDGADWLLEAHVASGYHVVARKSPEETEPFRQACDYLLNLSSVRAEERY
jgi:hypothetical protein